MSNYNDIANQNNNYDATASTNDSYVFSKNNGQDTINDYQGVDSLIFNGVKYANIQFVLTGTGDDLKITGYNGANFVTIKNFFYSDNYKIENFIFDDVQINLTNLISKSMTLSLKEFNKPNSKVSLSFSNEYVWNGPLIIKDMPDMPETSNSLYKFNSITTTKYNDIIYDGKGVDEIYAGAGNDTLYSRSGSDYLQGGNGADNYIIGTGVGHRTVEDNGLKTDIDALNLTGMKFEDARFKLSGNSNLNISTDDWNTSVTLKNVFSSVSYSSTNDIYEKKYKKHFLQR